VADLSEAHRLSDLNKAATRLISPPAAESTFYSAGASRPGIVRLPLKAFLSLLQLTFFLRSCLTPAHQPYAKWRARCLSARVTTAVVICVRVLGFAFSPARPPGYPLFFREIAIMAIPSTPKATVPTVVPLLDPSNNISAPTTQQMIPIMKRSLLIFSFNGRKPNVRFPCKRGRRCQPGTPDHWSATLGHPQKYAQTKRIQEDDD
jgi:hypothetical protein